MCERTSTASRPMRSSCSTPGPSRQTCVDRPGVSGSRPPPRATSSTEADRAAQLEAADREDAVLVSPLAGERGAAEADTDSSVGDGQHRATAAAVRQASRSGGAVEQLRELALDARVPGHTVPHPGIPTAQPEQAMTSQRDRIIRPTPPVRQRRGRAAPAASTVPRRAVDGRVSRSARRG